VPPINRPLDDKGMLSYFLGRVTKIDNCGLWYEHIETRCKSFIFFNNLISIAEEIFVEKETEKEDISVKKQEVPKNVEDLSNLL
jgi:stress response protein SCP2